MSLFTDIKNALTYLLKGEWREFAFRLKVYTGQIDLGIDSTGASPTERSHPYSDSGGRKLESVLDTLNITPRDAILDFGSGKGGALITFSRYPFARITGVELSAELVAVAEENLRKLKIENVQMIVGDAAEFTDLDEYNFFYFFNPFPGNVMRAVIENIEASLKNRPRKVVIIYYNPEYHDVVTTDSSFAKIAEYDHDRLDYHIYSNVHQ